MPTLHELQSAFIHDIYTGEKTSAPYLMDGKIGDSARLNLYYHHVLFALTDVLKDMFPITRTLVGEEFFKTIIRHYIKAHPSPSGNVHLCGANLSEFLASFEPAKSLPYLPDMVALEWAYFHTAIADDCNIADFEALQTAMVGDENFVLSLCPSVRLVPVRFNVFDIWQEHQKDDIEEITLEDSPHTLLVWRDPNDETLIKHLSEKEVIFLQACQAQKPFAHAMGEVCGEDICERLQQDFATLMQAGVFTLETIEINT